MAKILLDYVFPISVISPLPPASTAFLKQVCVVAKPASGQEGNVGEVYRCTTMSQVAVRTDNLNAQQLFNAGLSQVWVLLADDLDLADAMTENSQNFFTTLISDDFSDNEIAGAAASGNITITNIANLISGTADTVAVNGQVFTAQAGAVTQGEAKFQAATSVTATAASLADQINHHAATKDVVLASPAIGVVTIKAKSRGTAGNAVALAYTDNDSNIGATKSGTALSGGTVPMDIGAFKGVYGISSALREVTDVYAVMKNCSAFFEGDGGFGAKSMFYAFGSLLANPSDWRNQQYIAMPSDDGIDLLGDADDLFAAKVSFALNDDEFSNVLAFFACGGKAIIAPYIIKNLMVDSQSKTVSWISGNQPQYTVANAALLENRLNDDVVKLYIDRKWITQGNIQVEVTPGGNFSATASINISEPSALWKLEGELMESLS